MHGQVVADEFSRLMKLVVTARSPYEYRTERQVHGPNVLGQPSVQKVL